MRNAQAATDARHARTGKDGAFFDANGVLLATVESFQSNVNFNNASYSVLGNAQELEAANTFGVTLTMSQVVVEDDQFIQDIFDAMEGQTFPSWTFQGSLLGRDEDSEERVTYYECVPSGQVDLQNITVGDVVKRNWNFHVNQAPSLDKLLTVNRG